MSFFTMLGALFVFTAILAAIYNGGNGRDSTDAPGKRSALIIMRDHATGVQYIGAPFIGLTVRLDKDGKPYTGE